MLFLQTNGCDIGINWNLLCVCLNFPLFFESVDVVYGSLCGKGAVIWVEFVGDNLGDVVGACNVGCVGCWCGRGDVAGVQID